MSARAAAIGALVAALSCSAHPPEPALPEAPPAPDARPSAPPDAGVPDAAPPPPPVPYLRGQTHAHSAASGDSRTPLTEVARFYGEHGYDFVVVTDHNRVTELPADTGRVLLLPGIELTHNPASCEPPPPEPGGGCRIHVNGLFVTPLGPAAGPRDWKETHSKRRLDMYQAALDEVAALGGITQLNHPTWHHGVDGALLTELARRGVVLVEVANQGFASWNQGTARHPSSEAVWDAALSAGATLYAIASDDAHHYYDAEQARARGERVYAAGRGFIMVRAPRDPAAIRAALLRGDFYASTGVLFESVEVRGGALDVVVAATSPGPHHITVIGTGGVVLSELEGRAVHIPLTGEPAGYRRAVVSDSSGARAWTQAARLP